MRQLSAPVSDHRSQAEHEPGKEEGAYELARPLLQVGERMPQDWGTPPQGLCTRFMTNRAHKR